MNIRVITENLNIDKNEIAAQRPAVGDIMDRLWSGQEEMTGWVQTPINYDEEELEYILNVADVVREEAELMVVLGIGGSYLGAKAAIEALPKTERGIEVKFLGINLCSDYYADILEEIKRKKTIACVISKSGNTMEVMAAFEIVKPLLIEKYGSEKEAAKRIIAITDAKKGKLREEAEQKGYVTMAVPDDVGGRYSVMTPVGLFPMAVSGIDVREFLRGAADMATSPEWDSNAADYAIARYLLQQQGKVIEVIELASSKLEFTAEWMKQLYGESEGKDGKGLWPASLIFSTDLHSMGQYLQQGRQIFFETMMVIDKLPAIITVPDGDLKGKTLAELNRIMMDGVSAAHKQAGIPLVEIHLPEMNAYNYGQLMYYLMTTCAITAMLSGVNPFDQPGVEAYKAEMRRLLEK
ncbi:MAG: glucose-6-phosphate isomerase [Lentihominibacter sp.]|jgi:glucose-6-phosphate isomerase